MKKFITDKSGVTIIEYGLIAALIAIALIVVLETTGTNLSSVFDTISTKV